MDADTKIFFLFNNLAGHSHFFDTLVLFLAEYLQYFLLLAFIVLLYRSRVADRKKLRIFLVTAAAMVTSRFGVTELIRFFYHRPRPFQVYPVHQVFSEHEWSFPSGHSALFFAMATSLFFYNKKWGVWFFATAILMNASRVIAGVHYPSDILGGALIGTSIAYVFYRLAKKMEAKKL